MKKSASSVVLGLAALFSVLSCQKHLVSDPGFRKRLDERIREQRQFCAAREGVLFSVLDTNLTVREKEALKYLLADLPISDASDLDGKFLLENVRTAFRARDEMPWGKRIPDDVFLSFVLPLRVNRERIDSARSVFYRELRGRVRSLSMTEAALDVNRWCHEKVTYRSTSTRVASPLSMILAGFGRCGEESVFAVTALRSVSIPARTCYTPRWAHCDDNHAWIEIWVDGQWHYAGACEPAPRLDMAWFTRPAGRAMLVLNQVYGEYVGPEDVVFRRGGISQINSTPIYASTKKWSIRVLDIPGRPVPDAEVGYHLYNYGEWATCLKLRTDDLGLCSLSTGLGDIMVRARSDDWWSFRKVSVFETDTADVVLDRDNTSEAIDESDMVPPMERDIPGPNISKEELLRHDERLRKEDKLRKAFEDSWMDSSAASSLAKDLGLELKTVQGFIAKSRGNFEQIAGFLSRTGPGERSWAVRLLQTLEEKDFRDTRTEILSDHLNRALPFCPAGNVPEETDLFVENVLAPRIQNESLLDYRSFFVERFPGWSRSLLASDPDSAIRWIRANIMIVDREDLFSEPMHPIGVFNLRKSDVRSIPVFAVALFRTFGIPSRLNPVTKDPEFRDKTGWRTLVLPGPSRAEQKESPPVETGTVRFVVPAPGPSFTPEYEKHFTLSRKTDDGFRVLDFSEKPWEVLEKGPSYSILQLGKDFEKPMALPAGSYVLATGNRLEDGTVLTRSTFFAVKPGQTRTVEFLIRTDQTELRPIGRIGLPFVPVPDSSFHARIRNRGLILVWMDPDQEPSKHAIRDLSVLRTALESWNGGIVCLFDPARGRAISEGPDSLPMPAGTIQKEDSGYDHLTRMESQLKTAFDRTNGFPVAVLCDRTGTVVFVSTGYRIGLGEQIVKTIRKMEGQ